MRQNGPDPDPLNVKPGTKVVIHNELGDPTTMLFDEAGVLNPSPNKMVAVPVEGTTRIAGEPDGSDYEYQVPGQATAPRMGTITIG